MQKAMFTRVCAILAIGAGVIFAAMSGEAAPRYQAEMSVSGYTGTETLENFPVLVRISADKISGFEYGQCLATDGGDISFVDAEGNVLSHEVDTWDTAGESTVWVRIPSLAKGTTFTMRWGDASPASQTAANTTSLSYTALPSGWGTTVKAIQFGFEDAGHWSDVIEWFSASAPVVGAVTLDGTGGDTIVVKGNVTSLLRWAEEVGFPSSFVICTKTTPLTGGQI